jgi:hypothetical protein
MVLYAAMPEPMDMASGEGVVQEKEPSRSGSTPEVNKLKAQSGRATYSSYVCRGFESRFGWPKNQHRVTKKGAVI